MTSPRIYCLIATRAPVVAVFRRGPSAWSHVGRWDLAQARYEPGAWLGGRLFPRRSDISPDGRLLCYFAHKPGASWEHGEAYVAISRLPWLTALHAFPTCGTWTRGYYFTEQMASEDVGVALPVPFGLRSIPVLQFANERRRGWHEASDSPLRTDAWDEQRNAHIEKPQPHPSGCLLHAERLAPAEGAPGEAVSMRVRYWLEADGDIHALDDLQWADWDEQGRLLAATHAGKLQVRHVSGGTGEVAFEHDLADLEPDPVPPPAWAHRW